MNRDRNRDLAGLRDGVLEVIGYAGAVCAWGAIALVATAVGILVVLGPFWLLWWAVG